ncbi:hypothetical protein CCR75_004964 [Bremia lactucae]|uniref:Uncharacterized protein n=1 Tax=Bremia lactucae TaxID=4779 RepID=A0A976FPS4_BRELC|nr:hypothetical protein CCR75_004964 [Bremia lactucae]
MTSSLQSSSDETSDHVLKPSSLSSSQSMSGMSSPSLDELFHQSLKLNIATSACLSLIRCPHQCVQLQRIELSVNHLAVFSRYLTTIQSLQFGHTLFFKPTLLVSKGSYEKNLEALRSEQFSLSLPSLDLLVYGLESVVKF